MAKWGSLKHVITLSCDAARAFTNCTCLHSFRSGLEGEKVSVNALDLSPCPSNLYNTRRYSSGYVRVFESTNA